VSNLGANIASAPPSSDVGWLEQRPSVGSVGPASASQSTAEQKSFAERAMSLRAGGGGVVGCAWPEVDQQRVAGRPQQRPRRTMGCVAG
jgi:hypothetical protein